MADSDRVPPRCSTSTDRTRSTSRTTSSSTQTTTTTTATTATATTDMGSPTTKLLLVAAKAAKPHPPPGTYVIQIPKDTIYRVPPPENAKRFDQLSKRHHRQIHPRHHHRGRRPSCGCCCGGGRLLCVCASFSAFLLFLIAASAVAFYLVIRPRPPHYRINSVSITGFEPGTDGEIAPGFDFSVRAHNRNKKMEMLYRPGSSAAVYYNGIELSTGSVPVFEQGKNQVTTFRTALKGDGIVLTGAVQRSLMRSSGTLPFKLSFTVPVKFRVWRMTSWTFTANVDCDVTVDALTANATVVSQKCGYGADVW